jgi:hypothetical protein
MVVASVFESEAALELLMVKTMAPVLVAVWGTRKVAASASP